MDVLYDLAICSFPNDDDREWSGIGLFASRAEAEQAAREYLTTVPGFKDYYCEAVITEVPVIGSGKAAGEVFRFMGWNTDVGGDETDISNSPCYVCRQDALAALEEARKTAPRQEWTLDRWVIGERAWQEGFVREYPDGRIAPTLQEIRNILLEATDPRQLVKVTFHYSDMDRYFFPLKVGTDLFLAAEEFDFLLDGFTVRRVRDVEAAAMRDGIYSRIMAAEGWLDRITVPDLDISGWKSVFNSLQQLGRNIIVEEEHLNKESHFAIGFIRAVEEDYILLQRFDADGIWDDAPIQIFFDAITSVTFDSRYINVFSKYLPPRP